MSVDVLIRVDGGPARGMGHVYRMRALAAGLSAKGIAVTAMTVGSTPGADALEQAGLPVIALPDASTGSVATAIAGLRVRVAIIDCLDTSAAQLAAFRQMADHVITIDDTAAGLALADMVINPIVFHWGRYSASEARAALLEGPDYIILQEEIDEARAWRASNRGVPGRVVVAFGGADTHGITGGVVDALLMCVEHPLDLLVNLGPATRWPDGRQEAPPPRHQVTVRRSSPSLLTELARAELVVCGGGMMLYELAALGVPAVAVANEPHEIANIAWWCRTGSVVDGGSLPVDGPHIAAVTGELMGDKGRRDRMAAAGRLVVDARGRERCERHVMEFLR